MRQLVLLSLALAMTAACGGPDGAKVSGTDAGYPMEEMAAASAPPPPPPVANESIVVTGRRSFDQEQGGGGGGQTQPGEPASARQMAYTFNYQFAVPTGNMQALQSAHESACNNAGPSVCYVVNASINGLGEDYASGHLVLKASAEWVKTFQAGMEEGLKAYNAELDASNSTAEDLTVQLLDTSARLESAKTLRDRLQQLLADRPGKLSDLLEIERELARVQAEIDSTESILAAMRLRVSMSTLTLGYSAKYSAVSQSIWRPLGDAFEGFLPNVVRSMAGIIEFISAAALWIVLFGVVIWVVLWRMRRRKPKTKPVPAQP